MLTREQFNQYRTDICAFAEEQFYCPESKQLIKLEDHQKKILRDCFTQDKKGKFSYQTIIYSCPKKSGKTTIAALIALWYALTQEPPNEIYTCANDFEQSKSRVFATICKAINLNPYLREATKITGNTILFKSTGTTIIALASDYSGAAGSNHGLTLWDELWGYVSESSHRLWDELTPVPTRRNSIRFITTYAGFEGESELLFKLYNQGKQGTKLHQDLPVWTNGKLYCYWDHKPRMVWQTKEYYQEQRESLRPNTYLRLHENIWTTSTETFVDLEDWDSCIDKNRTLLLPTKSVPLSVGIDASVKWDSSAIVGCYYDKSAQKIVLAFHRIWQPSPKEPLDLEETLESYILELKNNYWIGSVYYDPYQFHRSATTLNKKGLRMIEYPQTTGNLTSMSQNLYELIKHNNIILYPDEQMRKAASQAVAIETSRGWRIAKEKAAHKIDVIVALAMACNAAVKTPASTTYSMGSGTVGDLRTGNYWGSLVTKCLKFDSNCRDKGLLIKVCLECEHRNSCRLTPYEATGEIIGDWVFHKKPPWQ